MSGVGGVGVVVLPTRVPRDRLDAVAPEVFEAYDGDCGSPRVHAELLERSEWSQLSVNTVAERMAALNLRARKKRKRRSRGGSPDCKDLHRYTVTGQRSVSKDVG